MPDLQARFVGANDADGNAALNKFLTSKKAQSASSRLIQARLAASSDDPDHFGILLYRQDSIDRRMPISAAIAEPVEEAENAKLMLEAVFAEKKYRADAALLVQDEIVSVAALQGPVQVMLTSVPLDERRRALFNADEKIGDQIARLKASGFKGLECVTLPDGAGNSVANMLAKNNCVILAMDKPVYDRVWWEAQIRRQYNSERLRRVAGAEGLGGDSILDLLRAVEIEPKLGPASVRMRAEFERHRRGPRTCDGV